MLSKVPVAIPPPSTARFEPAPFVTLPTVEHQVPSQWRAESQGSQQAISAAVADARDRERWVIALERSVLGKPDNAAVDLAGIVFTLTARGEKPERDLTAKRYLKRVLPSLGAENLPQTAAQVRNLINWQRHPLPSNPALDSYTGLFLSGQTALRPQERTQLLAAFERNVGNGILDSMPLTAGNMDDQISRHLKDHAGLNRFRQHTLMESIGRRVAGATTEQRNQLLLTAQMLQIDPELGMRRNRIAGYDLYSQANAGRSLAEVRGDLKEHLVRNKGVSPAAVDATAHILLASVAPEFLVRGVPDTLHVGAPAWVALRKTVALLEESAEGSSRVLTFGQVLDRAVLKPLTPEQTVLFHAAETDPLLDWAKMHGVIATRADDQYTVDDVAVAAKNYNAYIEATHQATTVLSTPVKTRRELARADLKSVFPDRDLSKPMHTVEYRPTWPMPGIGYQQSLVDLHMMGQLKNNTFKASNLKNLIGATLHKNEYDPEILRLQPHFKALKHSEQSLNQSIQDNTGSLRDAISTGLKDILSKMPYADRQALQTQELTFYRVETESINGKGTPIKGADEQAAAVQGRYGFLVSAGKGKDAKCFEFFPMSGIYVERPDFLATLAKGEAIVPRVWVTRMKSHADGKNAGESEVQIRALRETVPASKASSVLISPLGFFSQRADAIAQYVARQNLVLHPDQLEALAKGETPQERFVGNLKLAGKTVLNILIPFKACYDDIVSGRVSKDLGAMTGCATDVVMTIAVVGGGVTEGVTAVTRAEGGFSKLAATTRAVGSLTNALLNPAAGLSEPLLKVGKWLEKNTVARLSKPQGAVRAAWHAQLDEQRFGRPRQMRRESLDGTGVIDAGLPGIKALKPELQATRAEVKNIVQRAQPLAVSKLDDALKVMADPALTDDVDFVLKHFQGMSPTQARKMMTSRLAGLKTKAQALTTKNIKFMRSKDHNWVAQTDPSAYKVDKSGKFFEVNIDGAKHYYQHFGSHGGAMSNALIHELDHLPGTVTQGSVDFAYLTRLEKNTENARGLLNLAKGHVDPADLLLPGSEAPELVGKTGVSMYGSRAGSMNAESTMTSVALLSQLKTDPALFKQNRTMIEEALTTFGAQPITDQVGIRIVSKRSVGEPGPQLIYAVDEASGKLIGVYKRMPQPPGAAKPEQPPTTQVARNQAFKNHVQEHLVF